MTRFPRFDDFTVGETVRLKSAARESHPLVSLDKSLLDYTWVVEEIEEDGTHFLREKREGDEGICVHATEIERFPG